MFRFEKMVILANFAFEWTFYHKWIINHSLRIFLCHMNYLELIPYSFLNNVTLIEVKLKTF